MLSEGALFNTVARLQALSLYRDSSLPFPSQIWLVKSKPAGPESAKTRAARTILNPLRLVKHGPKLNIISAWDIVFPLKKPETRPCETPY